MAQLAGHIGEKRTELVIDNHARCEELQHRGGFATDHDRHGGGFDQPGRSSYSSPLERTITVDADDDRGGLPGRERPADQTGAGA